MIFFLEGEGGVVGIPNRNGKIFWRRRIRLPGV